MKTNNGITKLFGYNTFEVHGHDADAVAEHVMLQCIRRKRAVVPRSQEMTVTWCRRMCLSVGALGSAASAGSHDTM